MACDDGAPPSKSQPQPKPLLNPEPVTPTPTLAPIPRSHPYPYPYPYPYPVPVPEPVPLPLPLPLPLPVRLTLPPPTATTPTLNRTRPPTPTPAPNQATPTRGRCARSGGTSTGPRPSGSWRGRPKGSDPCQNARGYLGIHGLFSSHAILVRTYSPSRAEVALRLQAQSCRARRVTSAPMATPHNSANAPSSALRCRAPGEPGLG